MSTVDGLPDDSEPDTRSEMPEQDQHALDLDQPGTQGTDPITAAIGDEGEGDLAPEDDPESAGGLGDGPTDLRTEI